MSQKKKKMIPCALLPSESRSQCRQDAPVDMLGICVCLCALFTHVLSQEAEEPISYRVSGAPESCGGGTIHTDVDG